MTRVRKPARSLETARSLEAALEIVEAGIKKIVTNIRATAPEQKRRAARVAPSKGPGRSSASPAPHTP